ncbi:MAG: YraN family protein [Gammaproteobacteria bacterium]|nr:YraN family protein [Gammaproteobacteria bacterium]
MSPANRKGLRYEDQARIYLQARGLHLLNKNFSSRGGEIDLIMRDRDTICFIEVKFRKSLAYGGAANTITISKQRKIVNTALYYIASRKQLARQPLRFDAFLIQRQPDGSDRIDWIQNAFYAE